MFCRYCGKQIEDDALRCMHCGKMQWEKETPTPDAPKESNGFMQAPSLEDAPVTESPQAVEPVAVPPTQLQRENDRVYPPRNTPLHNAEDFSASVEQDDDIPSFIPSAQSVRSPVIGYVPPAETPAEDLPTRIEKKKKKGAGKKIAGVLSALLFLVIIIVVGWSFSNHSRFALQWEQTERDVASVVSGKLDGEKLDMNDTETDLSMGSAFVENEDVDSRYYRLDSFENVGEAELVCHFENKKLSGAELFSTNREALIDYICDTFDIDPAVMENQAQLEYEGTYVVLVAEDNGARAMFADTTYGGACSVALEPYFGI